MPSACRTGARGLPVHFGLYGEGLDGEAESRQNAIRRLAPRLRQCTLHFGSPFFSCSPKVVCSLFG